MILVGNGKVITRDNNIPIIENGCVAIEGNKIEKWARLKALKRNTARQGL